MKEGRKELIREMDGDPELMKQNMQDSRGGVVTLLQLLKPLFTSLQCNAMQLTFVVG